MSSIVKVALQVPDVGRFARRFSLEPLNKPTKAYGSVVLARSAARKSMIIDPERVAKIMRETAEIDVLPRFQNLSESEIMEKTPGDIVTVADYEAEKRLTAALKDLLPGADILAEEAASQDGLDLEGYQSARTTWLIDPVDGTRNFSKGDPTFAIVIALVKNGQTELACIHLPVEDRQLKPNAAAHFNKERLAISPPPDISGMTGLPHLRATGNDVPVEQNKERAHTFSALKNFAARDTISSNWRGPPLSLSTSLALGSRPERLFICLRICSPCRQPYNPLSRILGLLCAPDKQSWQNIYDHLATPTSVCLKRRTEMVKVAFIGLGVLGYPMARHLGQGGYDVTVYNCSAENAANGRRRSGKTAKSLRGCKRQSVYSPEMTMI